MKSNATRTLRLTQMSLLCALLVVMSVTPIGFVMIPPVAITLMHIPVIIGAVLMGPLYGGLLGGFFGILSLIKATTSAASPVDMMFSPFLSGSPLASLVMTLVPRILLGVIAGYAFLALRKICKRDTLAIGIAAIVASACHSLLVLGCLSVFFSALPLKQVFLTIVTLNGFLEIIVAAILGIAVCTPLLKMINKSHT